MKSLAILFRNDSVIDKGGGLFQIIKGSRGRQQMQWEILGGPFGAQEGSYYKARYWVVLWTVQSDGAVPACVERGDRGVAVAV